MKCGVVEDQGVEQPGIFNAPRVMVQSGTIIHHITRVDPMKPHLIGKGHLDSLKLNTTNGFVVQLINLIHVEQKIKQNK